MENEKKNNKLIMIILSIVIIALFGIIILLIFMQNKNYDKMAKYMEGVYNNSARDVSSQENNNQISNTATNNNVADSSNNITNNNTNKISREEALKIALNDLNISENDIYDLSNELDYKYGKTVYEIEFQYRQYEYEYYIDAESGEIVKSFNSLD